MTTPLALSDSPLATLQHLASPLSPRQRRHFLDRVMKHLAGVPIGDASVHMAGLRAQQELRREQPWLSE